MSRRSRAVKADHRAGMLEVGELRTEVEELERLASRGKGEVNKLSLGQGCYIL
jgi:hypothetical protein